MNNNNIGWVFRLIKEDIALAKENTARVFDWCSIFLGSGDIICCQTIQYYVNHESVTNTRQHMVLKYILQSISSKI